MNKLLKGAAVLGVGTLVTKIIGAIYRIPLVGLIGAEGIGIYQMVFPFYLMLLTVSSSGIPTALSKIIAEGKLDGRGFFKAQVFFGCLGLILSTIMIFASNSLAALQGNSFIAPCYRALAPAVFFVSIIAPIRGCFQASGRMLPTSSSQILEQVIKVGVSLFLIIIFSAPPARGAYFACIGITLSEALAAIYLVALFIAIKPIEKDKSGAISRLNANLKTKNQGFYSIKAVVGLSFPIMLCSIMIPLSRAVDGFLVVRLLKTYTDNAVKLYGLYSGGVESIIGVSTALVFGLSQAGIPLIAKARGSSADKRLIGYTFIFSSLASLATLFLGGVAVRVLFKSLKQDEIELTIKLLRLSAPTVIGISLMQATASVLIAMDKAYFPAFSMLVGVLVKISGILLLVKNPMINIYGNAFCDILCFFVASFFNLLYIICEQKQYKARTVKALT